MNASLEGVIGSATDPALIDRARTGDLGAFEEIVRARMDATYRLCLAILGDEADAHDAAQETFVAAWQQIAKVRDVDRFDAWLQRVTVNAARMALRGRGRRRVREIPAAMVESMGTVAARSDAARLDAALRRLSFVQRSILVLHHLEGRPVAELAEILGIPAGTVKSRLHTARQALQAALDADGRER